MQIQVFTVEQRVDGTVAGTVTVRGAIRVRADYRMVGNNGRYYKSFAINPKPNSNPNPAQGVRDPSCIGGAEGFLDKVCIGRPLHRFWTKHVLDELRTRNYQSLQRP